MKQPPPTWSVIVPTYRRPVDLRRCLVALSKQRLPGKLPGAGALPGAGVQVVVGRRSNDEESAAVIAELRERFTGGYELVEAVIGPEDNLTTSMNAALAMTTGELVALNDDDAESPPDWLAKLAAAFEKDTELIGVGGRDWQPRERWDEEEVGVVRWYGKVIGNHHLGAGPARGVDLLKGVNCAFRGEVLRALKFDQRFDTVNNWEMSLCFTLRKLGWKLIYDPAIAIDHHVAQRVDGDTNARGSFAARHYRVAIHNETVSLLEYLPLWRWPIFLGWSVLIGTRGAVGAAQVVRLLVMGKQPVSRLLRKCGLTALGRAQGLWTVLQTRRQRADLLARVPRPPAAGAKAPGRAAETDPASPPLAAASSR